MDEKKQTPVKRPVNTTWLDSRLPKWRKYVVGLGALYILAVFAGRNVMQAVFEFAPALGPAFTVLGAIGVFGTAFVVWESSKMSKAKRESEKDKKPTDTTH